MRKKVAGVKWNGVGARFHDEEPGGASEYGDRAGLSKWAVG
jgi:hypothetical protein